MKNTTVLLSLFILFSLFSSCTEKRASENPQKDIIGKWETSDHSLMLDISPNKELFSVLKNGGITNEQNSKIIFIDNDHIYSTWKINIEVFEIKVYADELVLISPKGEKEKLKRLN